MCQRIMKRMKEMILPKSKELKCIISKYQKKSIKNGIHTDKHYGVNTALVKRVKEEY